MHITKQNSMDIIVFHLVPNVNLLLPTCGDDEHQRKDDVHAFFPLYLDGKFSSTMVSLEKSYLSNYIRLKVLSMQSQQIPLASFDEQNFIVSADEMDQLKVSFTLSISRDRMNWTTVADYAGYSCFGDIELVFPTQSVRYSIMLIILDVGQDFHESYSGI